MIIIILDQRHTMLIFFLLALRESLISSLVVDATDSVGYGSFTTNNNKAPVGGTKLQVKVYYTYIFFFKFLFNFFI